MPIFLILQRTLDAVALLSLVLLFPHPVFPALECTLTLLGMAFLTGAGGIFLLAIVTILLYQVVAPLEEQKLLE